MAWAVVAAASIALPNWRTDYTGGPFHISVAIYTFEAATIVVTTTLVFKIRALTSVLYRKALTLLLSSYAIVVAAGLLHVGTFLFIPYDHWYTTKAIGSLPYIISGLLLLMSGAEFNRIRFVEKTAPNVSDTTYNGRVSSIDIITTIAALASNPSSINPLLDKLRLITARLAPGQALTPAQQTTLAEIYLKLEEFLVTKESIRQFKAQDLRQMIEVRFKGSMQEPTFWERVETAQSVKTKAPQP